MTPFAIRHIAFLGTHTIEVDGVPHVIGMSISSTPGMLFATAMDVPDVHAEGASMEDALAAIGLALSGG